MGQKQVFRIKAANRLVRDIIALHDEKLEGEPLLRRVMIKGERKRSRESLRSIRDRFVEEFEGLDESYKTLEEPATFPVELGPRLKKLQTETTHEVRDKELGES